jgi:endonuclease-3
MPKNPEKLDQKQARVKSTIRLFQRYYPDAHCALDYETAAELLFATILSAQCTDERVNQVTKVLFKKYPKVEDLANAALPEIEAIIRPTGFYKNKAKNLKACAQALVHDHGGEVPQDMDALVHLAGVGRKTANVVLGNAFQITSGVVVDTHVTRLSRRLGWTQQKTAEKIEEDLQRLVPKQHWIQISHWLIHHGRLVCKARKPACQTCFLDDSCPKRLL